MESALNDFLEYLDNGWGKKATRFLKPGATFKLVVDENPFVLSKHEGKMEINPGSPKDYDVSLEISCSAIEYFCKAKTEDEAYDRLWEIIYQEPTSDRYFRMKIEVENSPKELQNIFWKGFIQWARRMGFVH